MTRCVDCGGPFIALRSDAYLCLACRKIRQHAAKRRWKRAHPEYMRAAHRAYMRRHAVCKISVLECEMCHRLWTRHGMNRGTHCAKCSPIYEREQNAFRCLARYRRLAKKNAQTTYRRRAA